MTDDARTDHTSDPRPATQRHNIAQYNIARLLAPLDDPLLADFVRDLDRINGLGDASPGFVWRLKTADGTSTSVRIRGDERLIVNYTVWSSIEALHEFTFRSAHVEVYRRRREWFELLETPFAVLWWIPSGHVPDIPEAEARLDHLIEHGPTAHAFTFKQRFPAPSE